MSSDIQKLKKCYFSQKDGLGIFFFEAQETFFVDFSYIEKFPIHVQANFDYLEGSDRKNNITSRSGIDFYTGYRSVKIL